MDSIFTLLLARFAVIVGMLVVVALVGFAVALVLKRRGRLAEARRRAAPVVRAAAQALNDRDDRLSRARPARGGQSLAGTAVRAAARYLEEDRHPSRDRGDAQ